VTAEIRSPCPSPECAGHIIFIPLTTGQGAVGECDECGATFQLSDNQTTMIRPPKRD